MIAMALACRPQLLIADEPTTALDVMVQAQVLDLLTGLVRDLGLGLVVISHDLSVLGTTCDRLAVMYAGQVVEEGPARQVLDAPNHPYTRALAAAFPTIGDHASRFAPAGLPGDPPFPGDLPSGCPFHPRCPSAIDRCVTADVRLEPVGDGRSAACILRQRPGMTDPVPVLEARGVQVRFRGRSGGMARAVDGVDLAIAPGEVVALAGESGCGKTTLARTLQGLERPAAGEIRFNGEPLQRSRRGMRAFRRRVQLVLQDPSGSLNPRHTVYEAVAEALRIHKVPGNEEQLVSEALSRAGLRPPERYFLRYPHELSGGQRQRVVIAGALVLQPEVLVADEPVSSLDASVRGEILALLLKLRDELGLSVLVVTHDLGLAWNIADRLAVMYLGRIVEVGPTEEVLRDPQHPYTRALLSVVPEIDHMEPTVLQGEPPDPTRVPDGCRFHPRCPALLRGEAAAAGVDTSCRSDDLPVLQIGQGHSSACWLSQPTSGTLGY